MPITSIRVEKTSAGSSRNVFMTASRSAAATSTVISPRSTTLFFTRSPRAESTLAFRASRLAGIRLAARDGVGSLDLVLQLHQAVEQGLGRGRASGDVDVHGNDAVAAAHDGVR